MEFAKEVFLPVNDLDEKVNLYFLRIDIDRNEAFDRFFSLNSPSYKVILDKNQLDVHPSRFDQTFFSNMLEQYISKAKCLSSKGVNEIIIAADNDGCLQKILSPRFNNLAIEQRMAPLLKIFERLKEHFSKVVVLLTVEELAPGGLDATDGIFIAKRLEKLSAKDIIATSGTRDFLPLYRRRCTKEKRAEHNFYSNEPALASAAWLKENTNLNVSCLSFIDNKIKALNIAEKLGLKMLIEKAESKL